MTDLQNTGKENSAPGALENETLTTGLDDNELLLAGLEFVRTGTDGHLAYASSGVSRFPEAELVPQMAEHLETEALALDRQIPDEEVYQTISEAFGESLRSLLEENRSQEADPGVEVVLAPEAAIEDVDFKMVRLPLSAIPGVRFKDYTVTEVYEGGFAPHFAINGTRFIPLEYKQLQEKDKHERYVRMLRNSDVSSIMIADTSPTDVVVSFASEIVRQGLTLHFRDHHAPMHRSGSEVLKRNASILESLSSRSGGTFQFGSRDEYPTCSMLLESGDLKKYRIDAYICMPCDLDSLGTYIKGMGLRFDHFPGSSHPMELDVAMIDSPQSRKTRAMFVDFKKDFGSSMDPEAHHQMLPASSLYLQAYGGIAMNEGKFKQNLHKLNLAFVRAILEGTLDGPNGRIIREMADVTTRYDNVLKAIMLNYARIEGPVITINLGTLNADESLRKAMAKFNPEEDPQTSVSLAAPLIGKKSYRVHTGRIKQLVRDLCESDWGMRTDAIVVLLTSDKQRNWQAHVEGIGLYSRINFARMNENAGRPMFRTILGSRALVDPDDFNRAIGLLKKEAGEIDRGSRRNPRAK